MLQLLHITSKTDTLVHCDKCGYTNIAKVREPYLEVNASVTNKVIIMEHTNINSDNGCRRERIKHQVYRNLFSIALRKSSSTMQYVNSKFRVLCDFHGFVLTVLHMAFNFLK